MSRLITLKRIIPKEDTLMHGTSEKAYKEILESGKLTDMTYDSHFASVFLTSSYEIAKRFALKESYNLKENGGVVLYFNIKQMIQDGLNFYMFSPEVILSDDIPIKYISHVIYVE